MTDEHKATLFWELAEPKLAMGEIEKGTMMGFPCLRVKGKFFACVHRENNDLIVKLPAERVQALITANQAESFAPNGRVFREWARIPTADAALWEQYLEEAQQFVTENA